MSRQRVTLDGPPNVTGWRWKQIVMAAALAVSMGLKEVADAIRAAKASDDKPSNQNQCRTENTP